MGRSRLEREYSYHIYNLRKFYASRKHVKQSDSLEDVKAYAWRSAILRLENETTSELLAVIRHAYIIQDFNLTMAGQRYLFTNKTKTRQEVRKWFSKLDSYFFEEVRHV